MHDFSQEIEVSKLWNVVLVVEPFYNKCQGIVNARTHHLIIDKPIICLYNQWNKFQKNSEYLILF